MIFISKKRLHAYIEKRLSILEELSYMEGKITSKRKDSEYYISTIKNYSSKIIYLTSILTQHGIPNPTLLPMENEK